jgi:fatty acid-binding protein DegV
MRFGILVDATCDIPDSFLADPRVVVLPIHTRAGERQWLDGREPEVRNDYIAFQQSENWKVSAETSPLTMEEAEAFALENLVTQYDYVFALPMARARSAMYQTLSDLSMRIQPKAVRVRSEAGVKGPFRLHVIDAATLFAGHGAAALALMRAIDEGMISTRITALMDQQICPNAYGYLAPTQLYQIYSRAKQRGDRSVNLLSYSLGSVLDVKPIIRGWRGTTGPVAKVRGFEEAAERIFKLTLREIDLGLLTNIVVVSYGGDLEALPEIPGYSDLVTRCKARNINLYNAPMGISAMVNVGPNALCVGFITNEHTID